MKLHKYIIIIAIFFASLYNLEAAKIHTKDIMPSDLSLVSNQDKQDFLIAMHDYVSCIFILEHISSMEASKYSNFDQMIKFLDDNKNFHDSVELFIVISAKDLLGFDLTKTKQAYAMAKYTFEQVKSTRDLSDEGMITVMMLMADEAKKGILGKTIEAFAKVYEDIRAAQKGASNWEDYSTHNDML